jgi:hypothetical protein
MRSLYWLRYFILSDDWRKRFRQLAPKWAIVDNAGMIVKPHRGPQGPQERRNLLRRIRALPAVKTPSVGPRKPI